MRRLILPLVLTFFATAALAAPVTVPLDQSRKLSFSGFAASVVVANPEIADVNVVNEQTILVVGKRRGMTNVVILDRAGRTLFEREIMVSAGDSSATVTITRGGVPSTYACTASCEQISGSRPVAAPAATISPSAPVAAPAP
jgi:Flp pilus assembly secretin CpaC